MRFHGIFVCFLALPCLGQLPDLDGMSEGLDWSILSTNRVAQAHPADGKARHLAVGIDGIPADLRAPAVPMETNLVQRLDLPAAATLVVADPARVGDGHARMADAIARGLVKGVGPLHVAVHGDNKFSIALPLTAKPAEAMPLGLDLSPLPPRRFAGLWLEVAEARRDDTRVLAAVRRIRMDIEASEERANLAELYFFPGPNDWAFVALEIQEP